MKKPETPRTIIILLMVSTLILVSFVEAGFWSPASQLTDTSEDERYPSISDDGVKVAFERDDGSDGEIFVVNSDGTGEIQLTSNSEDDEYPCISGDGSKVAFTRIENSQNDIYLVGYLSDIDIDLKPPVTVDDYNGKWRYSNFIITLTATDSESGVYETYYKINDGERQSVGKNGQPRITTEGANNTLEYWSVDYADNKEKSKILTDIKLEKSVSDKESSSLVLSMSATTLSFGGSTYITGALSPPKEGATITIGCKPSGESWTTLASVTTDSEGEYSYTWTPDASGAFEVRACLDGDAGTAPCDSNAQPVIVEAVGYNPAFPTEIIVGVVVAVALIVSIILLVIVYLKRKKT